VEAATNGLFRDLEVIPRSGSAGMQLKQRLLGEVECGRCRVGLEIGARAIPLDRIAPLRNLPLKLDLR
jgi:hypothetical protein